MAAFYRLYEDGGNAVIEELFCLLGLANENEAAEHRAATMIRSAYVGKKVRALYHTVHDATTMIQRNVKGWSGRRKAKLRRLAVERQRNRVFFDYCATTIQKRFRGHWSRVYRHGYYARKAYLEDIATAGEKTVDFLHKIGAAAEENKRIDDEKKVKRELKTICSDLHHLISTRHIPGIYNGPYSDVVPSAFGMSVEDHLKQCAPIKVPYRTRHPRRKLHVKPMDGLPDHAALGTTASIRTHEEIPHDYPVGIRKPLVSETASVGRLRHIQGPFRTRDRQVRTRDHSHKLYRSVQSQSAYNIVEETIRKDTRLSKLCRLAPDDFRLPSKNANNMYIVPSIHAETTYRDQPIEFRDDYAEVPKIKNKAPFYVSLKRKLNFCDYEDGENCDNL